MAEEEGVDKFAGLAPNVRSLLDHVGWATPTEEAHREALENTCEDGLCMTCSGRLGQLTILCIDASGIIAAFCGSACFQDMNVMQWMEETHDDILSAIQFRGGQVDADAPEEDAEGS